MGFEQTRGFEFDHCKNEKNGLFPREKICFMLIGNQVSILRLAQSALTKKLK